MSKRSAGKGYSRSASVPGRWYGGVCGVALTVLTVGGCGVHASVYESARNPVWASDGRVYYLHEFDGGGDELWSRERSGSERKEAQPEPSGCGSPSIGFLFELPDGLVGVGNECGMAEPVQLLSYDPAARAFTPLVSVPYDTDEATVLTDRDAGFLEVANGHCDSLAAFGDGVTTSVEVTVDGRSWRLDQGYSATDECGPETGYVRWPRLTRDDATLVFLASGEPVGTPGRQRADPYEVTWRLVLWDLDPSSPPRVLDTALPGAMGMALAPDGRTAAVTLYEGEGGRIVLVDLQTGDLRDLVTGVSAWDLNFSPNGTQLVYSKDLQRLGFADIRLGGMTAT